MNFYTRFDPEFFKHKIYTHILYIIYIKKDFKNQLFTVGIIN